MSDKKRSIELGLLVTKKATDPTSPCRVSIGAVPAPPDAPAELNGAVVGYYCTYRGTKEHAIFAMEAALAGLKAMPEEPEISPADGKKYA